MTLAKKYYMQVIFIYIFSIIGIILLTEKSLAETLTHMMMISIIIISLFISGEYIFENQSKLQFSKIFLSLSMFFYLLEAVATECQMEFYSAVPYVGIDSLLHFIRNGMLSLGVFFMLIDHGEKWNKLRLIIDVFVFGFFVIYISWFGFINIYINTAVYDDFQKVFAILYIAADAMIVFCYILIYMHESSYLIKTSKQMEILAFGYILFSDLIYFYSIVQNAYYPYMLNKLIPISFFLIALSLDGENVEYIYENGAQETDKYLMIILVGMGMVSFRINPDLMTGVLFSIMVIFRLFSDRYTRNYELSESLVQGYIETNKNLKLKAEDLSKLSFELENRIIQRTRELENINKELVDAVNTDILTRLPNRTSFIGILDSMIASGNFEFAVIFIDVDRFKTINDWYGHEVGDYILSQVARRIRKNIDEEDIIARLGGDEFGLVIKNFQDRLDIINFSGKILSDLRRPFITKERKIFITVSVGISIYPEHAKTRSMLMKYADIALYKSKAEGKDRYTIYDLVMRKAENRRLEIENILYDAIEKNEFSVEYKPQFEIQSSELKVLEAFIKWDSDIIGSIKETEFLGIAEENGLIIHIGKLLLEEVIKDLKYINTKYNSDIVIAINISPRQFMEPMFVEDMKVQILKYDVKPNWLEIEVTEELIMSNEELIIKRLNEISSLGIKVVLDKFGKGYSSFIHLKKLPIDKLKLDAEFIKNIENEDDYKIVRAIMLMCKYMGVYSAAEEVSNNRQIRILKSMECDFAQGDIYGKNMNLEEIENNYFNI